MIDPQFVYLAACVPFLLVWALFFFLRKDLRKEMLLMSIMIGILSVITAHYWWTVDWWKPQTITNTTVGIEDFLSGFGSGGILAVAYEVVFKKRLYSIRAKQKSGPYYLTLLFALAGITGWLFWVEGLTSFWASTTALIIGAGILFYYRSDLILNGVLSGVLMVGISLLSYFTILILSPGWIASTYQFETLSGALFLWIPVEEFVFWFLAGLFFGPLYEYWQGKRTRRV